LKVSSRENSEIDMINRMLSHTDQLMIPL